MDYTLSEIVNHKNNIINLSNNLINTSDVNQEISINEELIKQSQFLLKLLNIKKNLIYGQNFQNNNINIFNSMPNQINMFSYLNNDQLQEIIPRNDMVSTQVFQKEIINLRLRNFRGIDITILCSTDEKVSELIQKYKNKILSFAKKELRLIFNNKVLDPNKSIQEEGLKQNSFIFVYDSSKIRRG